MREGKMVAASTKAKNVKGHRTRSSAAYLKGEG
jgi:hypothetical protein